MNKNMAPQSCCDFFFHYDLYFDATFLHDPIILAQQSTFLEMGLTLEIALQL